MNQQRSEHPSQAQDNLLQNTTVSGNLTFAPVQIGTKIETLIVESSLEQVTQRQLIKKSPYQGLKRFNFKDRDRFFGRDTLIARLFEAVNRSSLSLVLGASGSGKSSVVRAGLIPELKKSLETHTFYDFVFTPNRNPFDSLYRALLSEEKDYHFSATEAEIALTAQVNTLTQVIRTLKRTGEHWLIFIDQFEELFTICSDADQRTNFIAGLVEVARTKDSSVRIVLAMRSDFLEQLSFYPDLGAIANQNNLHLVTEMYPDELRQAIEQPAAQHGVVFEEGLVKQIIEEVEGQKGYLPLLQYTLNLLWETECQTFCADRSNIEDRILKKSSYASLEGVRGALKKRVNEIYHALSQDEQAATKQVFLKLVNIIETDSGRKAISKRAYRSEFSEELVKQLLDRFIQETLLVSHSDFLSPTDSQACDSQVFNQAATVEIAHEILLSSWDRLKNWLEEEKEAIILKNWLASEAKRWQKIHVEDASKAQDELLKGSRLDQIIEFSEKDAFRNVGGLSHEETEFIAASVKLQAELEQEKANRRKREIRTAWGITAGSLVALVVSSSLGLLAWKQSRQAELNFKQAELNSQQAELNLVDALAFSALTLLNQGNELDAFTRAIKAGKTLQKYQADDTNVINALQEAWLSRSEYNRLLGHTSYITSVSFSPNGKTLATSSDDKTIKLWNPQTGKEIRTLTGHTATVMSVSFSSDGKTLATGSQDKTTKLWNPQTGKLLRTLTDHTATVMSVSFSPDGKTLATGSQDKTTKLWNLQTGKLLRTLVKHTDYVASVSFSPNGKTLATGSADKTVKLWDPQTGQELRTLTGHTNYVATVSFSPDSKTLATSGDDKTIKLWNLQPSKDFHFLTGHQELRTLIGHTDYIAGISFSPNGRTLATVSGDQTGKLWNLETSQEIRTLIGHTKAITSVSFSPDGKTLATSSDDKTIKLWNSETGKLLRPLIGHQDAVTSLSFSPNGKTLATGSEDNTIKLWNPQTGKLLRTLTGHQDAVWSISVSPDGKTLATGSADKTVTLWNLETGQEIRTFTGHTKTVWSISFSPDGKTLATGSDDKTIKLWNLETGQELRTLTGHTDLVWSISFSPDGKTLATGSQDKIVRLLDLSFWTMDLESLLKQSCNWVNAYLESRPDTDPNKHICDRNNSPNKTTGSSKKI